MANRTIIRLTEPRLTGRALWVHRLNQQRKWIEYCEANGRSYAGPNGAAIRQADYNELHTLEARARGERHK